LGRVIQDQLKKPLAEELLFGSLQKGGVVMVELDEPNDRLSFSFRASPNVPLGGDSQKRELAQ
jgi:ATP-dependent Clp protease ATP-binding subunit ClpA